MKTFDLIDKGSIQVMSAGHIEKYFELSLQATETIRLVKAHNAKGEMIVLRYSFNPETEHLNHIAEKYERFISKYYERIDRE